MALSASSRKPKSIITISKNSPKKYRNSKITQANNSNIGKYSSVKRRPSICLKLSL